MAERRGPAAGDDRHRRAARHRSRRARLSRASRCTTWTTSSARWPATAACARPRRPGAGAGATRRSSASSAGCEPRRGAHDRRAARARRGDRGAGAARERAALGVALGGRPRAAEAMARAIVQPAAARADAAAEGSAGDETTPTATCRRCASCSGSTCPRSGARRERTAEVTDARAAPPPRSGDPAGQPRQRAGAGAGRPGRTGARSASEVELVVIRTSGDERPETPPTEDKERFVKEIEEALLDGRIDMAVHSAKDVPGELPDGLAIVGVPERADPRDALCGAASLDALAGGRRGGHRQRAPPLPAAGAARPTWRCARCAATWTRGCASWPTATTTRWCWRAAGLARLGARRGRAGGRGRDAARRPARAAWRWRRARATSGCARLAVALTDLAALVALTAERALVARARGHLRHARSARIAGLDDGRARAARLRGHSRTAPLDPRRARGRRGQEPGRAGRGGRRAAAGGRRAPRCWRSGARERR